MKICIGIVGENGAGKSTVAQGVMARLELRSQIIRFSDILLETLELWGISPTRQNLQILPQIMAQAYGLGSLTKAVAKRIQNCNKEVIIVEGVRWLVDEKLIYSFDPNLMVYVTAPREKRYKRLIGRKEKKGEEFMTWEQFLKEDSAPNEVYIPSIGSRAKFKIVNDGSGEKLEQSISELVRIIKTVL